MEKKNRTAGEAACREEDDKILYGGEGEQPDTVFDDYGSREGFVCADDEDDDGVHGEEDEDMHGDDFSEEVDDGGFSEDCFDDYGSEEDSWLDEVRDDFESDE